MSKGVKKSDEGKPWNKRTGNSKPYATNTLQIAKTFLIVCEGANTEPEYFKSFPVVTAEVKVVGAGRVRTSLVKEAIRLKRLEENRGREVWCVFDYDDQPDQANIATDFHTALELAAKSDIKVAWSNDTIELWFILHHQLLNTSVTRQQYYQMLDRLWTLKESYTSCGKRRDFCATLYERLLPYQANAINNARRLFEQHVATTPPAERNPCTTVFMLVEELNKYLKS